MQKNGHAKNTRHDTKKKGEKRRQSKKKGGSRKENGQSMTVGDIKDGEIERTRQCASKCISRQASRAENKRVSKR